MSEKKYCPICDQPIKGRFCTTCKQFVKPYQHEVNYRINEGHDPNNDPDCDYHGTTVTGDLLDESKYPNVASTASTASADERMESAKRSFETHGRVRSVGGGATVRSSTTKTKSEGVNNNSKGAKVFRNTIFVVCIALVGLTLLFDYMDEQDSENDDDYYDIADEYYYGRLLSDEDYDALLEENGFDEDGTKELDYDEILEAGEACNGYDHFEGTTARTVARHIRNTLEDEYGISSYNAGEDLEMNNYAYMDYYGDIYTYYESYMYVVLGDGTEDEDDECPGFVYIISDSVTDEVMELYVMVQDQTTFISMCNVVMTVMDEEGCGEDELSEMEELVIGAAEEEVRYSYAYFGNLWFDFSYYGEDNEDYYAYVACITPW